VPQSLAKNLIHLVYSTKNREHMLTDAVREELHRYSAGILKEWESPAILINSVEDHIHILYSQSKNHCLAKIVEEVKKGSSRWIKTKGNGFAGFYWQNGYGAFSVSPGHVEALRDYIANQEEHHRTLSFQDEYRRLLTKYGVQWDERYVWD
jgi:REP element-mobilizing transposase RayT